MVGVVADTHAILWFVLRSSSLSPAALDRMRQSIAAGCRIHVPSVCLVEIVYLVERGRVPRAAWDLLRRYLDDPDSGIQLAPLDRGVAEAIQRVSRDRVPDMPDRIIAATAAHLGLPLVTHDARIRTADIEVVW